MQELIFVYNGDSGLVNSVMHLLHKKFSPHTYDCQLCMLVYDGVRMNQGWLDYVAGLGLPSRYLHRDHFAQEFGPQPAGYPALYLRQDASLELLLGPAELQAATDLEALMARVGRAVQPHQPASHELQPA